MEELAVDPSEASLVGRVAQKHASGRFLFSTNLNSLALSDCFRTVIESGASIILLIPEGKIDITVSSALLSLD